VAVNIHAVSAPFTGEEFRTAGPEGRKRHRRRKVKKRSKEGNRKLTGI
jgi:hypothetical protein